jgi:hypothetical protein
MTERKNDMAQAQMQIIDARQARIDEAHTALNDLYERLLEMPTREKDVNAARQEAIRAVFRLRRALERAGVHHSAPR